jgi:sirohydrochlorin cobaltochelatase
VIETFVDRVHEILAGQNLMNCQLCKYRTQVLGFEAEVGLAQTSHHHHVEGIGTAEHGHVHDGASDRRHGHGNGHHHHDHDHSHDHGHHHEGGHHPYPHADHPLGPRSLKRV